MWVIYIWPVSLRKRWVTSSTFLDDRHRETLIPRLCSTTCRNIGSNMLNSFRFMARIPLLIINTNIHLVKLKSYATLVISTSSGGLCCQCNNVPGLVRTWLICLVVRHCLKPCFRSVHWLIQNNVQWNMIKKTNIFIKTCIWKWCLQNAAILYRLQCCNCTLFQWPLLLTWFNFNPSMDK